MIAHHQSPNPPSSRTYDANAGIAIVGMAGRFPGANSVAEFWNKLICGESGIIDVAPNDRSRLPSQPKYVAKSAVINEADRFDAAFFGIYPKQAAEMDPQHRLFLETAWHALEDAGYQPDATPGRVGVFAGCHMNTYIFCRLAEDAEFRRSLADSFPGGSLTDEISNDKDYLATRIAYHLNLRGPCVAVQTACSTSLVAIAQACESLTSGACHMAIAGGATITFPQRQGYLYTEDSILAPDGICRAFDAEAKGTIFGDGVGAVILKPLKTAVADGDSIYAVIKGWGVNNDGGAKAGYTAPSVEGQSGAIEQALTRAGITADTIDYVEAHGTGTQVGDPIEIEGLTTAFRKSTDKKQFCRLASLKTNFGHLDVAAGVAGVIKTSLSLQHRCIPKILNYVAPNPRIPFEETPFVINHERTDWPKSDSPRRAGVSSFGVGGTNAHLILEEAPETHFSASQRVHHCLPISGKSEAATDDIASQIDEVLNKSEVRTEDLAFTLQTGRKHHSYRTFRIASNLAPSQAPKSAHSAHKRAATKTMLRDCPVVFLFPGQGSQHPNMAKQVYRCEPVFAEHFDNAMGLMQPYLNNDLRSLIYSENPKAQAELSRTCNAQPALFAISYALAKWWMSRGVQPSAMVGHSVGEFTAAALAGIMSLPDAARLVALRGQLMQRLPAGSMLSINLGHQALAALLPDELDLAASNAPHLCVVSGPEREVERFQRGLGQYASGSDEIVSSLLKTSHAFHSRMMDPAVEPFRATVAGLRLEAPKIPIYSTVRGELMDAATAQNPDYWARQIREPVLFADTVALLLSQQPGVLLEVGPSQALTTLTRQQVLSPTQCIIPSLPHAKQHQSDLRHILNSLGELWCAGVSVNWRSIYEDERRNRVHAPGYAFESKRHWFETATADVETHSDAPSLGQGRLKASSPQLAQSPHQPSTSPSASTLQTEKSSFEFAAPGDTCSLGNGDLHFSPPATPPENTSGFAEQLIEQQNQLMHQQLELLLAEQAQASELNRIDDPREN